MYRLTKMKQLLREFLKKSFREVFWTHVEGAWFRDVVVLANFVIVCDTWSGSSIQYNLLENQVQNCAPTVMCHISLY